VCDMGSPILCAQCFADPALRVDLDPGADLLHSCPPPPPPAQNTARQAKQTMSAVALRTFITRYYSSPFRLPPVNLSHSSGLVLEGRPLGRGGLGIGGRLEGLPLRL
jgi:hypothetical protein